MGARSSGFAPVPAALVGRAEALAVLEGWLARDEVRRIHVTGPAGTGKTALGLALADRVAATGARVGWAHGRAPERLGVVICWPPAR